MDGFAPLVSHWASLGYSQEHAFAMIELSVTLIGATSQLNQSSQAAAESATETTIYVGISEANANALPEGSLVPDATLLPLWKQFAVALGSLATKESVSIELTIVNIQFSTQMLSILEPAFRTAPLKMFWLSNSRLGIDGINFVTRVLEANHSLSYLWLQKVEIGCGPETFSLLEAARKHPAQSCVGLFRVASTFFGLQECSIDRILPIAPEIVPNLLSLRTVSLPGNGLGSHAADIITNSLATNPCMEGLDLNHNLFNDDDAGLFANSLKSNSNLNWLDLRANKFTDAGFKSLCKSVYDDQSPNAIYGSNHTCFLLLFDEGAHIPNGIDHAALSLNEEMIEGNIFPDSVCMRYLRAANGNRIRAIKLMNIEGRKKVKMLHAIKGGNTSQFNMRLIEDIPLELMPKVLAFLHESGKYAESIGLEGEEWSLYMLFQVVRSKPNDLCGRLLATMENFD